MSARFVTGIIVAFLCLHLGGPCAAHDGPEHEIDELTEQMKVQGESADLLRQRAIEYNVLGKYAEAAKDLERAIDLDESSVIARRELGRAYFSLGKTNEALSTVTRALKGSADAPEEGSLLALRAEILRARRDYGKALADVVEAIRQYPGNVEWYLVRSQLQALLKMKAERVKGLEDGIRETGSGLLIAEWIDALIANGQHTEAVERIEQEIQQSRWKATWLIRRAKVRQATGQGDKALDDLKASVEELNTRLGTSTSDALLLADRALAYDLMNKKEEARRDYRAARDKGLNDEWIRDRIRALRGPKDEE